MDGRKQTQGMAYTSGAGHRDLITHAANPRIPPPPQEQREMTPHTTKTTLRYLRNTHGKQAEADQQRIDKMNHSSPRIQHMHHVSASAKLKNVNKSKKNTSIHAHGYNILNNDVLPENQRAFKDFDTTIHEFNMAKQNTTLRPQDTMTGRQGLVPGVEAPFALKTSRPQAVLHSEGHSYNILTHRELHSERMKQFDSKSTKGFRRLANAFDRKRNVNKRGTAIAEQKRQRRANTIAKTAHVPRRQQNRGFNIINGDRWRDIGKHDPRIDPKKVGLEPASVWSKCSGHNHNPNTLKDGKNDGKCADALLLRTK